MTRHDPSTNRNDWPRRWEYRGHFVVKYWQHSHWYMDDLHSYSSLAAAKRGIDRAIARDKKKPKSTE